MTLQFSLFDLLILFGIIQGIITSVLLLLSNKNRVSNRFLALGLLSFCLLSTKPLLHTLSLWETQFFGYFPNALELVIAPLLYFYVRSLITPKFEFKQRHWIHFLPFFISQSYAFFVYFSVLQTQDFTEKNEIANSLFFSDIKELDEYVLVIATIIYLTHGYSLLMNYKKWLDDTTSDSTLPDFNWLKNLFQLFSLTAVILLISRVLLVLSTFSYIDLGDYLWQFLSLYIAFLIYYMGLRGYVQRNYSFPEYAEPKKTAPLSKDTPLIHIAEQIEKAMKEQQLYLDKKLSVDTLSNQLGLPQREVSQAINMHLNTNFRDYINNYRIEEVKSKLSLPDFSHMSIFGIADESGFNSEASFYRLFKKYTGQTPKEYLQQNKAE